MWYKEWLLGLVAISCFCSIVALIFPAKGQKGPRFVLSLIVILVVAAPILKLINNDDELRLPEIETEAAIEEYEDLFIEQVLTLSEIEIKNDITSVFLSFYGHKPEEIEIRLSIDDSNNVTVSEIKINTGRESPAPYELALITSLCDRYGTKNITVR